MRRPLATPFTAGVLLALAFSGCLGGSGPDSDGSTPTPDADGSLVADFAFDPANPAAGQPIQFTDRSQDQDFDIVHHAWDFGDGHGTTALAPVHAYETPGVYRVVLRVKNAAGTESSQQKSVAVRDAAAPPPSSSGGGTPGVPPVVSDVYPSFGNPVTVQGNNGGEPSIAIAPDGTYWVNPIRVLYRSEDGKRFDPVYYPTMISGDSHVVVDPDGRLWVSDLGGLTPPVYGSITVWTSTDEGESWLGNPAASDTVFNDRQWIAAPGGGTGYLAYRSCTVYLATVGCYSVGSLVTKTTDGGLTWRPLGRTFAWTSFPFVDPADGTLYVVQVQDSQNAIDVAVSTNGGDSFSQSRVVQRRTTPGSIFVVGAVDDAGTAYVAWIDRDNAQSDVWMSHSTSKGAKWSAPVLVSSGVGTSVLPWIAAGGDGKVAVAWYGTEEVTTPDGAPPSTPWHVYVAVSENANDAQPRFVQTRATGVVHVGPICTGGTGCEGNDRDLLDFLSLAIGPDGRVAVAYGEDGVTATTKTQFLLQTGGPRLR